MTRFAYVCKFCIYAKFAYVRKSGHVYAFTHVCKICTYAKVGKFAPASDHVQISFCVYAKFAYMQIWSCEQKARTYANLAMCTHLLTYAKFARMQKLENLHLPQTKCKSHFAYTQNLRICKSGHVNRKQNLHT